MHKSVVQQYTVELRPNRLIPPAVHELTHDPVATETLDTLETDFLKIKSNTKQNFLLNVLL